MISIFKILIRCSLFFFRSLTTKLLFFLRFRLLLKWIWTLRKCKSFLLRIYLWSYFSSWLSITIILFIKCHMRRLLNFVRIKNHIMLTVIALKCNIFWSYISKSTCSIYVGRIGLKNILIVCLWLKGNILSHNRIYNIYSFVFF